MKPITRSALSAALVLGASTVSLFAQAPADSPRPPLPPPPVGHHGPPPSPLFDALDTNHDGVISPDEITGAPAALKTLTDASGQITHQALGPVRHQEADEDADRPANRDFRPRAHRWDREWRAERGPGLGMDREDEADDNDRPRPHRRADEQDEHRRHTPPAARAHRDADDDVAPGPRPPRPAADRDEHPRQGPPPAAQGDDHSPAAAPLHGQSFPVTPAGSPGASDESPAGPDDQAQRGHHGPPPSPLFDALDSNHDGVISTDEMNNAPAALKKLDAKGSGQISRDDVRPPHPPRGPGN